MYKRATEGREVRGRLPRIMLQEATESRVLTIEGNSIRDFRENAIRIARVGEWLQVTEKKAGHMKCTPTSSADMGKFVGRSKSDRQRVDGYAPTSRKPV